MEISKNGPSNSRAKVRRNQNLLQGRQGHLNFRAGRTHLVQLPHFTDEATEAQRKVNDLPKVIHQISGRAQTRASTTVWSQVRAISFRLNKRTGSETYWESILNKLLKPSTSREKWLSSPEFSPQSFLQLKKKKKRFIHSLKSDVKIPENISNYFSYSLGQDIKLSILIKAPVGQKYL